MRTNEHLVFCGDGEQSQRASGHRLHLNLHGAHANVRLQISDISRRLLANIPDVLADLLEVASYVYAADGAVGRGGRTDAHMGAWWRRTLRFVIPVRRPDLWSSDAVSAGLVEMLTFLSDDSYAFEFRPLASPPAMAEYFELGGHEGSAFMPDEVILFSGGLDSLSGAVEELVQDERKVALVSHRSATKIAGAQQQLVHQLRTRFGADRLLHVPVWAHLIRKLSYEPTHRTRSFLFVALAAVVARLFGRDRIHFFENGIVSLNLPLVGQVVGSRATRTTHPQSLAGFRRVLSAVLGRDFDVENPFGWMTKAEVVEGIARNGCGDLIRETRSCTRIHEMTRLHPHCGACSQCLDRRFAVLAAGQNHEDPAEAYKVDLFLGERPPGPDREMALGFVRSATRISRMEDVAFFAQYGEVSRIVGYFTEPADAVAGRVLDLQRRHAATVCQVFDSAVSAHAGAFREGSLSASCLLSLIVRRDGGAAADYPVQSREPEEVVAGDAEIQIALDIDRSCVAFAEWGEIKGASAKLLLALAEPFRAATREERRREAYPFTAAGVLAGQINCESDETLRRRVFRCRKAITKLAADAGAAPPSDDAVIENQLWHGYRLNPDRIRIVALSELRRSS
jgi:7-cyano-7-deazaguanine synthase in queuosine biosynthesis